MTFGAWDARVRIAILYGAIFTSIGIITPFWPVWLEHRGLAAVEIGVIMAASQWSKVLLNPIVGSWVDRHQHRHRQAMVALATASLIGFLLLTPARGFWILFILTIPATAFMAALMPLSETVAMAEVRRSGADYGRMRLWGSVTFIVASIGTGAALEVWPVTWVVPAGILASIAWTIWATARLPGGGGRKPKGRIGNPAGSGIGRLLKNPRFLLFLGSVGLIQASHGPYYSFSTLHWHAAGLSETTIGILWALGVVVEVLLFAYGTRLLRRVGPSGLLIGAGLAGVIRWTVLAVTTNPVALCLVQGLHALTYAAAHLGAMHFIARAVPQSHAVRAQGLYSALAMGGFLGLAMLASGWLYDRFGGLTFLLATGMCLVSLILAAILTIQWRSDTPLWDDGPAAPKTGG